jgi:curli production assembly/transport component CsgE
MKTVLKCLPKPAHAALCGALAVSLVAWAGAGWAQPRADKPAAGARDKTHLNGSDQAEKESRRTIEDPLRGLVINRTVTVLGKDFYQYFVTAWRQKDPGGRYSITVRERPSARWGSEIWVESQRVQMFHIFLSPARQAVRKVSEQAAELVHQNIIQNEIRRAVVRSPDLAAEEL